MRASFLMQNHIAGCLFARQKNVISSRCLSDHLPHCTLILHKKRMRCISVEHPSILHQGDVLLIFSPIHV